MERDILLLDFDLTMQGGDFPIGDLPKQGVDLLLESFPGNWKAMPSLGASLGMFGEWKGESEILRQEMERKVKRSFPKLILR